jgi:hypothetical protein
MTSILIPTLFPELNQAEAANSPFHTLTGLSSRPAFKLARPLPAHERRLLTEHFQECFTWEAIRHHLPLRLVVPDAVPPWQPRRCRSYYQWLPPHDIHSADDLAGLDDFDLILRLVDFSAWRPILAQRFTTHLGPPPFDPVSLGLLALLGRWRDWDWPTLHTELANPLRGHDYRRRLGFVLHDLPSLSTPRVALNQTDSRYWLQCADSLLLALMAYGLVPTCSTLPSDSPNQGVSIVPRCVKPVSLRCPSAPVPPSKQAKKAVIVTGSSLGALVWTTVDGLRCVIPTHVTSTMRATTSVEKRTLSRAKKSTRPRRPKVNIILATSPKPSTFLTTISSPTGPFLALLLPPTLTTTCRLSQVLRICVAASPNWISAKSPLMLARPSRTFYATSMTT